MMNNPNQRDPSTIPFPLPFQFSCPSRYHTKGQQFNIGDLVWYEIKGSFDIHSKGIQWGEGVIKSVHSDNTYTLAGKTWAYDHCTHPLLGSTLSTNGNGNGPPLYMNISDFRTGRDIYRKWAQNHHPNMYVRRYALSGIDEIMHPSLSKVPGEAMFKVWDRASLPPRPIIGSSLQFEQRTKSFNIEEARKLYGENLEFDGQKQKDLGPEFWGITYEQLLEVQTLNGYNTEMSMHDVVNMIKLMTKGTGMGYALFLNSYKPLRAKQMVSHAWGERYSDFVNALKDQADTGPFWVCAFAIYQNEDIPNLTITKQLGNDFLRGPFATVLKQATGMIAVFTPAADIYTRLWCVFEMFVAVQYGVPVTFTGFNQQVRSGIENIYDAIYEHGRERCNSKVARCGNPNATMNNDEIKIRKHIESYSGKFDIIDSVVEWCKAIYHSREVKPIGAAFKNEPAHILLLGGIGRFDYLAKSLSSVALAIDRIPMDDHIIKSPNRLEEIASIQQNEEQSEEVLKGKSYCCNRQTLHCMLM